MIIGNKFIKVFAEEARKPDGIEFLAQGTIWPDILESEEGIKAHHNAGGLPEDMNFHELCRLRLRKTREGDLPGPGGRRKL